MYTITILDKSNKILRTYKNINEVQYFDIVTDEHVSISGSDLLTHHFMSDSCQHYQLISDIGNYIVDCSIIGLFEVEK